ncbi:MAG TPA: hydroxyethylthiazole kinase [Gammaproteobacteria bacterium]|nr:hydroxyethylthiazole kinase [Gammaproteobacteria bacterium]
MKFENIHSLLTTLKQKKPLVLNITNDVTMDFIANGMLSIGASPVMSKAREEMEDLIKISSAVVINLGTLDEEFVRLCEQAASIANKFNKPLILDPVGAGASQYRTENCMRMLEQHKISIVRGNAGEILALSGTLSATRGVQSLAESDAAIEGAKYVSKKFEMTILVSGKKDVVVEDERVEIFDRGSKLMPIITGSGCLLSAVVAAFHAIEPNRFLASAAAAVFYSVCGEVAALQAEGPGTFKAKFLDVLHLMPEKKWYEKN